MKVLVTGARGFLGSVLSTRWRDHGEDVTGLDNGERGLNPGEVLHEDVWDIRPEFLDGYDGIVHFAAGTGSLDRPEVELWTLNVTMTLKLYQAAAHAGVKWFVYPTTSLAAFIPDSPYVRTKEQALWLLMQGRLAVNSPRVIPFRFCNVIGAYGDCTERRKREVHLLPTLVRCAREGRPFLINGANYPTIDGTPARDFVDVVDVVDYIRDIVRGEFGSDYGQDEHGVYRVASGRSATVLQVVTEFRKQYSTPTFPVRIGTERAFDTASVTQPGPQYFPAWRNLTPWEESLRRETLVLLDSKTNLKEMFE